MLHVNCDGMRRGCRGL